MLKAWGVMLYCYIISENHSVKVTHALLDVNYLCFSSHSNGGGWMCLYSFICLSAGAVEGESSCFAITLLHHAPPQVTSVLVLFVIFGGLF